MRKYFALALMAFAALVVTSCDSDDSNVLKNAIDKVVAVANSKVMQGSMPSATDHVDGLTNTVTKSDDVTSIMVSSPVELSKFFISVAGVDGYLECPAEAVYNAPASRAEVATYSYVVVIALGDGAVETLKISVNAETVDGQVVKVVDKVEVVNTDNGSNADASHLVGEWILKNEDFNTILTLTDKTYSILEDWDSIAYETGTYEIKDGFAYMTPSMPDAASGQIEPYKTKIELYANNNALVVIPIYSYQDSLGNTVEEEDERGTMFFYKKNAKIELNAKNVQGTWLWFMGRNDGQVEVRAAMIFDGDSFDFIIPAWGQRMMGTFTCDNGYINFKVTKYLVNEARPCGIDDYKNGYEEPAPESWNTEPPFGKEFSRPFLPIAGGYAYSNLANLTCRLVKQ